MKIGNYALLSILLVICMMFSVGCVNINTGTDTTKVDETTNTPLSNTVSRGETSALPEETSFPSETVPSETTAPEDTTEVTVPTVPTETSAPAETDPDIDPSSPAYSIWAEYSDMKEGFWKLPTGDELVDTTWYVEETRDNGDVYWFEVTFRAGGADIRWNNDGEDHEYFGAFWTITHEDGVAIVEFDFGGLAGEQKCAVLITTEANLLYTCANMVDGDTLLCSLDVTSRTLERIYG